MKVLIAVDSSNYSDEILTAVARYLWPPAAEFLLLTVVEPSHNWESGQTYLQTCQVILSERAELLREKLADHKIRYEAVHGSAKDLIVETARAWGADLIIVGSHGDTGVRADKVGSVAAAIVNNAPCNVEVVKVYASQGRKLRATVAEESG